MAFLREFLKPGDILLYTSPGTFSWLIRWKTSEDVNHCELFLGNGESAAARGPNDGKGGVQTYPLRLDGLRYILRPTQPFDLPRMKAFHDTCVGQEYDLVGVLRVFAANGSGDLDKAYCSEHVARMCRASHGGPELFNPGYDCDRVSPGMLKASPHVEVISVATLMAFAEIA